MHEMQAMLIDVCGVCLSVCLSVMWLKLAAARAVCAACRVRGVIWCSLCEITLTTCWILALVLSYSLCAEFQNIQL